MSLSKQAEKYLDKIVELNNAEVILIARFFDFLYHNNSDLSLNFAKDDRAAELEASLIKFIIDSRKV